MEIAFERVVVFEINQEREKEKREKKKERSFIDRLSPLSRMVIDRTISCVCVCVRIIHSGSGQDRATSIATVRPHWLCEARPIEHETQCWKMEPRWRK